jgi:hypothetical protein
MRAVVDQEQLLQGRLAAQQLPHPGAGQSIDERFDRPLHL